MSANIGDSQAFVFRNNKPVPLTTPHRVYGSGVLRLLESALFGHRSFSTRPFYSHTPLPGQVNPPTLQNSNSCIAHA